MSETSHQKQDFIELAKRQLAQISAEFEKALDALKDPERRRQLTSSGLDVLQKGLSRAQETVARCQQKIAPPTTAEPSSSAPASESSGDAPATGGTPEADYTHHPPDSTD